MTQFLPKNPIFYPQIDVATFKQRTLVKAFLISISKITQI